MNMPQGINLTAAMVADFAGVLLLLLLLLAKQMFKLLLEKAEEPEIKLPTSAGSSQKRESSRKISPLPY